MERRHSERIKAEFSITYNLKNKKSESYSGTVLDLNRLGMRAILPQSLPRESVLELKMQMNSSGPVLAQGVVVWQYEMAHAPGLEKGYLTGIQFSRVLDIKLDHIAGVVERTKPAQADGPLKKTGLARITYTASYLPEAVVTNWTFAKSLFLDV